MLLNSLYSVDNQLSSEDFAYKPGYLPTFSSYDYSSNECLYNFPPTPFKTISAFVKKIREERFAESDFSEIIQKEQDCV